MVWFWFWFGFGLGFGLDYRKKDLMYSNLFKSGGPPETQRHPRARKLAGAASVPALEVVAVNTRLSYSPGPGARRDGESRFFSVKKSLTLGPYRSFNLIGLIGSIGFIGLIGCIGCIGLIALIG